MPIVEMSATAGGLVMDKTSLAPRSSGQPDPGLRDGGTAARYRRIGLATMAALIAMSAYGGALGLIAGFLGLGATVAARLPLHSPVLGGLALAAIVAVPCSAVAWFAARADQRTAVASTVAGVLLAGWILVELAFIRELSFFHPVYLALGLLLIWIGARSRSHAAG
jgi:hypothetical protein